MSVPGFSVRNPITVNLVMWAILIAGTVCAFTLVREMFPESQPNQVRITTVYPGASPAEVEKGISAKIEQAVKDIEDVDEIHTTISEGLSSIRLVLVNDVDDVDQVVGQRNGEDDGAQQHRRLRNPERSVVLPLADVVELP